MFTTPSESCSIFAASGDDFKITSVNRPMFHAMKGICELRQFARGNYEWVVTEKKGFSRKRSFKFKVTKFLDIQCHIRDIGQFQIIVKESGDTTQLLGRLDINECRILADQMNRIKTQTTTAATTLTTNGDWFCAKENLPQPINGGLEKMDRLKFPKMSWVLERGPSSSDISKAPLQNQSELKKNKEPLSEAIHPSVRPLQHTLPRDKPLLSHLRNKTQTKLFPSAELLEMTEMNANENSDGEVPTITTRGCVTQIEAMPGQARARSRSPVTRKCTNTSGPVDQEELKCAICTEQYTNPKLLHCMHSFCNRCLDQLLDHSANRGTLTCPLCHYVTKTAAGGTSGLWRNRIIEQKLKWDQMSRMRDNNQLQCTECETETATKFCTICRWKLCDPCATHHKRLARSRDHIVENIEGVTNEELFENVTTRCYEHKEEAMHYCDTCRKRACDSCVHSLSHQGHVFQPLAQAQSTLSAALQSKLQLSDRLCSSYAEYLEKIQMLHNKSVEERNSSRTQVELTFKALAGVLDEEKQKLLRWLDEPSVSSSQALSKARLKVGHVKAMSQYLREISRYPQGEIHDILEEQDQAVHWGTELQHLLDVTESRPIVLPECGYRFSQVESTDTLRCPTPGYDRTNEWFLDGLARKIKPGDVMVRLRSVLQQSMVFSEAAYQ